MADLLPDSPVDRRRCERLDLQYLVVLELGDGREIIGRSRDFSLSGVLLSSGQSVEAVHVGDRAVLKLDVRGKAQAYACQITRVSTTEIGLEVGRKQAAAFGLQVTQGLLKRRL